LKKEAKTFAHLAYALGHHERLMNKRFLVLFPQVRTASFLPPSARLVAIGPKKWRPLGPPSLGRKRPRKQRAEAAPLVDHIAALLHRGKSQLCSAP
jgi:hypothetical protein